MQVLEELNLKYVVVDYEADEAIVGIANFYNCLVLSSDADFYIYNIRGGYVHLNKIKFSENEQRLFSSEVEPVNGRSLPDLCDVPKLSVQERENLLYSILGCNASVFQVLPGHRKLVLAATVFWNTVAQPLPHLVKALLVSFLVCYGRPAPCFLPPIAQYVTEP